MTLALALRASDGLVLASDSRMSGGVGHADISEKFLQVNRDVGVMTYGLADPGNAGVRRLVDEVKAAPAAFTTMREIVTRAQSIFVEEFNSFLDQHRGPDGKIVPELEGQEVGFIIGGFDGNDTGSFAIYQFDSVGGFAPLEMDEVIAAQWPVASMIVPLLAYPGMSVEAALDLAVIAMLVTSSVEPTVGGPTHLATATLSEGFSLLNERETHQRIERNQHRFSKIRGCWREAWETID